MENPPSLILVSGPIAVGKSTVSKLLANSLDNAVYIEGDQYLNAHDHFHDISWETKLERSWTAVISAAKRFLDQGAHVIIDFVVEHEFPWICQQLLSRGPRVFHIVLFTDPQTIAQRLRQRDGHVQQMERSLVLLQQLKENANDQQVFIETTNKAPPEIVAEILKIVSTSSSLSN
ncbi:MAG: ATP-binding protein [Anaerolineae bacterium]|nr:ATP-binding protein [Anaerolineae bacterium]